MKGPGTVTRDGGVLEDSHGVLGPLGMRHCDSNLPHATTCRLFGGQRDLVFRVVSSKWTTPAVSVMAIINERIKTVADFDRGDLDRHLGSNEL